MPYPHARRESGVAVILQSGNLGINVTMNQRSLPLAFLASVGNQTIVEIADVVDAYLDMPETTRDRRVPRRPAGRASLRRRGGSSPGPAYPDRRL